ncbi:hypothetical protein BU26DRAFT_557733 [Trematosphaeria pertusa]|uniref:Uncharacterized protein n=1 Tax=Trematosphaeria pertusa TaxID=390896 RepID=A0A6A6J1P0_9PLEO|nr:uncharacterized protein BU26DRAFT_557733 [Trematosphaeria pertusa]KAF2256267.1 hypothetical protein BU26DRAFT_557733 [Trematosphaeria pertusa]
MAVQTGWRRWVMAACWTTAPVDGGVGGVGGVHGLGGSWAMRDFLGAAGRERRSKTDEDLGKNLKLNSMRVDRAESYCSWAPMVRALGKRRLDLLRALEQGQHHHAEESLLSRLWNNRGSVRRRQNHCTPSASGHGRWDVTVTTADTPGQYSSVRPAAPKQSIARLVREAITRDGRTHPPPRLRSCCCCSEEIVVPLSSMQEHALLAPPSPPTPHGGQRKLVEFVDEPCGKAQDGGGARAANDERARTHRGRALAASGMADAVQLRRWRRGDSALGPPFACTDRQRQIPKHLSE